MIDIENFQLATIKALNWFRWYLLIDIKVGRWRFVEGQGIGLILEHFPTIIIFNFKWRNSDILVEKTREHQHVQVVKFNNAIVGI